MGVDVTFLVPDVSTPSTVLALRVAALLEGVYECEIVGPDMGHGFCSMYAHENGVTAVSCPKIYRFPDYLWQRRRLQKNIRGKVIVAIKAWASTIPVALRVKASKGVNVIAFLDELDSAVYRRMTISEKVGVLSAEMLYASSSVYYGFVERMLTRTDMVVSTSTFLQNRFGGHVLQMGVDCQKFQPQAIDAVQQLKEELRLVDGATIVFGGVVRPHKGVEALLDAILLVNQQRGASCRNGRGVRLLVAGPITEHLKLLKSDPRYEGIIRIAGAAEPDDMEINRSVHDAMPVYLDLADLIVLPQQDNLMAQSQVPCKVFEAMAMAKPIIATRVSDLPTILSGCGMLVNAGDVHGLADAIQEVLGNRALAASLGRKARSRCIQEYSVEIMRKRWISLLQSFI